jgi:hypothetical protein
MAARITKRLSDEWREKIKIKMIINRLHDYVEGKCLMDASQVSAAKILLAKALPDLKQTEVVGSGENGELETITRIERVIVRPGETDFHRQEDNE